MAVREEIFIQECSYNYRGLEERNCILKIERFRNIE